MKLLILVFLTIYSISSFAQDYEREQLTRIYVLAGISQTDKSKTTDDKTIETIYTIGTSFRVSDFAHIGLYYSTNDHYGWIVGFDADDYSRFRVMVGNTKKTDMPNTTPDPYSSDNEVNKNVYTIGLGYDYQFSHNVGISVQGFYYDSGNHSANHELSAGLTFSF